MNYLNNFIKNIFLKIGFVVTRKDNHKEYLNLRNSIRFVNFLNQIRLADWNVNECLKLFEKSNSQNFQDIFVLAALKFKTKGFFIEAGACDGIFASNSLILEKDYNWNGIAVEPSKHFQELLGTNRNCLIYNGALDSVDGKAEFVESPHSELSSLKKYLSHNDQWGNFRASGKTRNIDVSKLNTLCANLSAPSSIDYLSLDTEGSEFSILNSIDFKKVSISVITVEHNYTSSREKIYELLTLKGFTRVFQEVSFQDDWYINSSILTKN